MILRESLHIGKHVDVFRMQEVQTSDAEQISTPCASFGVISHSW